LDSIEDWLMVTTSTYDILVAGNGPAGMAAALALANAGFQVAIAAPPPLKADQRTTALMMPSIRFLESIGVWQELNQSASPLRAMRIIDGTSRLIRSRPVTFYAAEIKEEAFGYNIRNVALTDAMAKQMVDSANIHPFDQAVVSYEQSGDFIMSILADGARVSTKLVVAADGRNSSAREFAGIKTSAWSYPQTAFVTTFAHRLPHDDMSTEFHTETGPFTQVPLPGGRSSLVWVVKPERAEQLKALDDAALSLEIERRMQSFLGVVTVGPERQTYPLSGQYPQRFGQNRVVLVGEAAHVFPPIGAQGLNLGLRDVEDMLACVLTNPVDPGSDAVVAAYDSKRRPDILARTGAVDALNRTLLSSFLPVQMARAVGLAMLDMAPPLRGLFMREGLRPGSGFSEAATALREKVRGKMPLGDKIEQR
jgi:2-octaprenyl-6-methoxyphenol hydroxylase